MDTKEKVKKKSFYPLVFKKVPRVSNG